MTPLHAAIEHMDIPAVQDLLAAGVDPNHPDPEFGGFRPLHLAVDIECEEAIRRYDKGDADARPRATITRLLIDAGADPALLDGQGLSPRDIALERHHSEALALFEPR